MDKEQDIQILIIKSFNNDNSEVENQILQEWLSTSSANQEEYNDLLKIWNDSENVQSIPGLNIDLEWQKFSADRFSSNKGKLIPLFKKAAFRYAAILVIALFSASVYLLTPTTYVTNLNRMTVELSDGSTVYLNNHSTLKVSKLFNWNGRNLNLDGEAFFEVAKNPEKPFLIHSESTNIEVLGTSFNYKTNGDSPSVMVNSGIVAFWAKEKNKAIKLTKGMQGSFEKGELISKPIENSNYLSWRDGVFKFEKEPILDALNKLESYYEIDFEIIEKDHIKDCRLTTLFEKVDLNEVLEELKIIMDFEIKKQHPNYILIGGSCP